MHLEKKYLHYNAIAMHVYSDTSPTKVNGKVQIPFISMEMLWVKFPADCVLCHFSHIFEGWKLRLGKKAALHNNYTNQSCLVFLELEMQYVWNCSSSEGSFETEAGLCRWKHCIDLTALQFDMWTIKSLQKCIFF